MSFFTIKAQIDFKMSRNLFSESLNITKLTAFYIFCKKTFANGFYDAKTFNSRLLISKVCIFDTLLEA